MLYAVISALAYAEPCQPRDLAADAEAAVTAVTDDELALAVSTAELAIASLACADRVPKPEDLASLWQALGTARLYEGDLGAAQAALRQSAVVYPGWYNDRLGPRARKAWEAAKIGELAELEAGPIPTTGSLVVDGAVREEQPVSLGAGTHLVQVLDADALVFSRTLTLEPGQEAMVATGLQGPANRNARLALWTGVASGVLASGAYAGALYLDSKLEEAVEYGSEPLLTSRRQQSLVLGYGVAPVLAAGAVTGVALHFVLK